MLEGVKTPEQGMAILEKFDALVDTSCWENADLEIIVARSKLIEDTAASLAGDDREAFKVLIAL